MHRSSLFLAVLSIPLLTSTAALAYDPVVNGGFEADGPVTQAQLDSDPNAITGWTAGNANFTGVQGVEGSDQGVIPLDGSYAALLGAQNVQGSPQYNGTLSQTVTDTPGASDTLTFWLASECFTGPACNDSAVTGIPDGTDNAFSASIAGQTLSLFNVPETGDGLNVPTNSFGNAILNGTYVEYSFTFTATGSDTLLFSFYNNDFYFALDDVSIADPGGITPAPIPEPATLVLLGTGIAGLAAAARRRLAIR